MRKLLSILLLALFGLPVLSPLLALGQDSAQATPACCRRDGKHQCMSQMEMAAQSKAPQLRTIPRCCESFPRAVSPAEHHDLTLDTAALAFAEIVSHPAIHTQTEARARVALDRSRRKRGPPATQLA